MDSTSTVYMCADIHSFTDTENRPKPLRPISSLKKPFLSICGVFLYSQRKNCTNLKTNLPTPTIANPWLGRAQ